MGTATEMQKALADHLAENTDAKKAFKTLALGIFSSLIAAFASALTLAGPDIAAAIQLSVPGWVFSVLSPILATLMSAVVAALSSYSKSLTTNGVVQALATPQPKAYEQYYREQP